MGRHAAVLLVINVPDESPRSPVGKPQFGHLIQEIPVPRLPYVFNLATLSPAFPHMHGTLTIERISDRTLKMTMASGNTGHTTETAMGSTSVQSVSYAIEPHSPHQDQVLFTYLEAP